MDAFANWMAKLNRFKERYDKFGPARVDGEVSSLVVDRHLVREENFVVLPEDVLIIGVYLIDRDIRAGNQSTTG